MENTIRSWWTSALLGEQGSAHPVFGERVQVSVDGDVVTLTGTVDSADEAEQLEREARSLDYVATVVNRLSVDADPTRYHLQAVLAVFPDKEHAELAHNAVSTWTLHKDEEPRILENDERGNQTLFRRARAAGLKDEDVDPYARALRDGKVIFLDRVPEDDALRVISALEGSCAEWIRTLPPEPAASEVVS